MVQENSTLLKIISGVLTPSSGRLNIHGRINAILELGSSLKPEMTGREKHKAKSTNKRYRKR